MVQKQFCGKCPSWVKERGLEKEEWVHDRWG